MRRRLLLIALLALSPGGAFAAEPSPPPDSCQNDLLATAEYNAVVRANRDVQRDAYEPEIARLRARVKLLEAAEAVRANAAAASAVPAP